MTAVAWGVGQIRMNALVGGVLYLPGVPSPANYVSTPDSAANSIPGDIDVLARVAATDWTPANAQALLAKVTSTGVFAWQFHIHPNGALRFTISNEGSVVGPAESTVATGFADGTDHWVRVTRRQSDGRTQFFTSSDGSTWLQLGVDVVIFAGVTIYDSVAPITIGARDDGGNPLDGLVYYAELRDGIDGTVVQSFDAAAVTRLGVRNPSTVAAGGPWTINGAAWDWVAP
jgi:hypothetical protein